MERKPTIFCLPPSETEGLSAGEIAALTNVRIWELVAKHRGLCVNVSKSFLGLGVERDDLIQEGAFGVYRAVELFRPGVGKFSGYAKRWVVRYMLDAIKHQGGAVTLPNHPLDHRFAYTLREPLIDLVAPPGPAAPDLELILQVRMAIPLLEPRQQRIVLAWGPGDRSLRQIAQDLDVTYQRVHQILREALDQLRSMFENEV